MAALTTAFMCGIEILRKKPGSAVAAPAGNAAVIGKNADNHTALRHFFVEELDEIKFRCLALSLALKIVPDAAVSNRPRQSPKSAGSPPQRIRD